ncbi:DUF3079 domain-containing protein [bacterium]|nr:DUF3079 domain-containing protein [bacterium]
MSEKCLPRGLLRPKHPERICWGCDKYCPAGDLRCGSGFIRTPHPIELFGEDWFADELEAETRAADDPRRLDPTGTPSPLTSK